ncbi:MAG: rhomboid family intramembrane serine protease [Puniceicoccaceae bacterium]
MKAEEEEIPAELVTVGRYRRPRQANDDTLLILSMGLPYWMVPVEQGYEVRVQPQVAQQVINQLKRSRRENRFWPQRMEAHEPVRLVGIGAFLPAAAILVLMFLAQQFWGTAVNEAGSLDVQAIHEKGQWWRVLTALTLHADAAHLIGNLGMGCFFSLFVLQQFGVRLGWLLILLSGALGNTLNASLRGEQSFAAIGASTAVFSAVGLVAGHALAHLMLRRELLRLRELMLPLFVAFGVLGWWGSSGENTDFMGHLFGLMAGLGIGCSVSWIPGLSREWVSRLAGWVALGAVILAWIMAIMSAVSA